MTHSCLVVNYAQLIRGVGKMVGTHTGLLDFKGMAKIATGVLTLRLGDASGWTKEVDQGFQAWIKEYLVWATTNELAIDEMIATKYVSLLLHCAQT